MEPNLFLKYCNLRLSCVLVLWFAIFSCAVADPAKDREECAEQLVALATCLPYVSGQAKAPTPDCCGGLKQVLKNNKKCLCVVVRDRNDPDLNLQINVTLALSLPSVCSAPANVSKCPELLHMDPHSPEAQVFYQLERNSTQIASGPSPSPIAGGPLSARSKASGQEKTAKIWLGSEAIVGVLLWNIFGLHMFG
ncbi:hypothetical protein UlMin_004744 [Ulmus minor]